MWTSLNLYITFKILKSEFVLPKKNLSVTLTVSSFRTRHGQGSDMSSNHIVCKQFTMCHV